MLLHARHQLVPSRMRTTVAGDPAPRANQISALSIVITFHPLRMTLASCRLVRGLTPHSCAALDTSLLSWLSPGSVAGCHSTGKPATQQARGRAITSLPSASSSEATASTSDSADVTESEISRRRKANLRFCQERAAWRRQLTILRKQWTAEWQAERQEAAAQHVRDLQERQLLQAHRAGSMQHDRQLLRMERDIRDAERAVELVRSC
jgi:hypothetical protein